MQTAHAEWSCRRLILRRKVVANVAIYHLSIKHMSRSGGKSAVASSAYRAGEKLEDKETGKLHDYTRKNGVVHNEIMLPNHAPKEYQNREVLWNEVQKVEKQSNARLAREIEVGLPKEMSREQQIQCVRDYVRDNFIKEGMCADVALHDKGDGNPHAHIMLTTRGIKENGKWDSKERKVLKLDENGERIPVIDKETGLQKIRDRGKKGIEYVWERETVKANNWNDKSKIEEWRRAWAEECNKYLSQEQKIDHRSYARQGIDKEPTVHEGQKARKMEKEGAISDRCEINRQIKEYNALQKTVAKLQESRENITSKVKEKAREINEWLRGIKSGRDIGRNTSSVGTDVYGLGKGNPRERETQKGNRETQYGERQAQQGKRETERREQQAQSRESVPTPQANEPIEKKPQEVAKAPVQADKATQKIRFWVRCEKLERFNEIRKANSIEIYKLSRRADLDENGKINFECYIKAEKAELFEMCLEQTEKEYKEEVAKAPVSAPKPQEVAKAPITEDEKRLDKLYEEYKNAYKDYDNAISKKNECKIYEWKKKKEYEEQAHTAYRRLSSAETELAKYKIIPKDSFNHGEKIRSVEKQVESKKQEIREQAEKKLKNERPKFSLDEIKKEMKDKKQEIEKEKEKRGEKVKARTQDVRIR